MFPGVEITPAWRREEELRTVLQAEEVAKGDLYCVAQAFPEPPASISWVLRCGSRAVMYLPQPTCACSGRPCRFRLERAAALRRRVDSVSEFGDSETEKAIPTRECHQAKES